MQILIVGCGYVGLPLGVRLVEAGHTVWALRRSPGHDVVDAGLRPLAADITDRRSLASLGTMKFDAVVNTVAAGGGGAQEYRRVYLEGMANLLDSLGPACPRHFIYTSSTSVYGQDDGSLVTEASPAAAEAETSQVLVAAEQFLVQAAESQGFAGAILRCAGIYGPGRGYWLQQFLQGSATLDGDGARWLNMIHRDDVAGAVVAVLERSLTFGVYNVVDQEPVQQKTVFAWLAERLKRPMPGSTAPNELLRKRGATNKRVSGEKLRLELQWRMRYPTFRQGYEAEIARLGAA